MDFAYQTLLSRHIVHYSLTINYKGIFCSVHGSHLGCMQIVGVTQSCRSSNQSRLILEHNLITNQQTIYCTQHFYVPKISNVL